VTVDQSKSSIPQERPTSNTSAANVVGVQSGFRMLNSASYLGYESTHEGLLPERGATVDGQATCILKSYHIVLYRHDIDWS
jgi:hypothetical protein